MVRIFTLVFLFSLVFSSHSQVTADFVFSEVVEDSVKKEIMLNNGKQWMVKNKFQDIDTTILNSIKGKNSFYVYQKGLVSKQIHGRIHYKFLIEVKDNKYRYTFFDFIFHYYKQDRSYKMVPTGKEKPLSDETAKGWQKTWEQHKIATEKQIESLIKNLKETLPRLPEQHKGQKTTTADF